MTDDNSMRDYCGKNENYKKQQCINWVRSMRNLNKSEFSDEALDRYCNSTKASREKELESDALYPPDDPANFPDPDCDCYLANTNKDVQIIKQSGIRAPIECWYQPCTDIGNKDYMISSSQLDRLANCSVVNCNMSNIGLNIGDLSGKLQTSITNTCGVIDDVETIKDNNQTSTTTVEEDSILDILFSNTKDNNTNNSDEQSIDTYDYNLYIIIGTVLLLVFLLMIIILL